MNCCWTISLFLPVLKTRHRLCNTQTTFACKYLAQFQPKIVRKRAKSNSCSKMNDNGRSCELAIVVTIFSLPHWTAFEPQFISLFLPSLSLDRKCWRRINTFRLQNCKISWPHVSKNAFYLYRQHTKLFQSTFCGGSIGILFDRPRNKLEVDEPAHRMWFKIFKTTGSYNFFSFSWKNFEINHSASQAIILIMSACNDIVRSTPGLRDFPQL